MSLSLDALLAWHCSPTFAGIKVASLVSCNRRSYPDFPVQMKRYREAFAPKGVCFEILGACPERFLVLVYRKEALKQRLVDPQVSQMLKEFGYPVADGAEQNLYFLKRRIVCCKNFPHEIGLFLGYPTEDVEGFILNQGKKCKMCGYWKVYGDEESAKYAFERYNKVSRTVLKRVEQGESLLHVFAAA